MTFIEFLTFCAETQQKYASTWRLGQTLFNCLCEVRPDLSEQLRATSGDPFFIDSTTDHRYIAALEFIEANW